MPEAKSFDEGKGNTLWWDTVCKELKNIRPYFEVWEKDISELPPGYQNITCHMIFDVNMGGEIEEKRDLLQMGKRLRPQRR